MNEGTNQNKANTKKNTKSRYYVEILGDTVSPVHVILSIFISVGLGMGGFLIGKLIFPLIAEGKMVGSYSLLLGIFGCVMAVILNALLFRPKRILTETQIDKNETEEILKDLQVNPQEEYEVIQNDPVTRKEMEDLNIKDVFMPKAKGE